MTRTTSIEKARYKPYEGATVRICWNSGNDSHPDECIRIATVIRAGAQSLWVFAHADGVKVEQDVFIPFGQITQIERVLS